MNVVARAQMVTLLQKGLIGKNTSLAQIIAWSWTDNTPLSEPMMAYVGDVYMRHTVSMK